MTFEYNNAFGLNQEEFLQAIIGAFVLQNSFGALSARMITGDESSVCNKILHRALSTRVITGDSRHASIAM